MWYSFDNDRNIQFPSPCIINGAILLFQAGKNCFVTLCGGGGVMCTDERLQFVPGGR